jgi:hypothetical protein
MQEFLFFHYYKKNMARRPFGKFFEVALLSSLDHSIPKTSEAIRKALAEKLDRPGLSWHTVNKYLCLLRDAQKIEEIRIGKVTTYRLKK